MADELSSVSTHAPETSGVSYTAEIPSVHSMDEQDWSALSYDLWQSILTSINTRSALEQNLKDWNSLYEMRVDIKNWPWANASNVFIPMIPAQLNTSLAYITGKVFVPRFYIVTGNTEDAASSAHDVERYYNAELVRQRGQTTWYDQYINWLHMSFRDGTCVMEILWRKQATKRKVVGFAPRKNVNGVPVMDSETGKPKHDRTITDVETIDYDDVELKPVLLRDFLLIPDEANNIEEAVGVARCLWLYETDLNKMVKDGVLRKDEVERALNYVPVGMDEAAQDMQGDYDKTMGSQLVLGQGQGSQTSRFFRNRGPIKVWRVHTRQYDLNEDDVPEENIFWVHELEQRMLGFAEYKYIVPSRPYFAFSPDPRPDRFYGYSLVERLAPIQAELNGMYNQRNDLITMMLNPPLLYGSGAEIDDNEQQWGPGIRWNVENVQALKFMEFPTVPLASFQNESLLNSYVDKLEGTSAPAMGAQSSGRRSATEMKQQAAATITRNDLTAMRLRVVCRAILNFIHKLKLQYLDNDPEYTSGEQKYTLPRETLAKDYQLDVAGSSDPIDASTRRQETLGLVSQLLPIPWIGQDQIKSYRLVRKVVDSFGWNDFTQIFGTEQEAQQRAQAQQKEQQEQKQMEVAKMAMGIHDKGGQQQHAQHTPHQPKPPHFG